MQPVEFTLMGLGLSDAFPQDIADFRKHYSLNTGNLLFNYAAKLICDLAPKKVGWGAKASVLNKNHQGLLIPMANHLGDHVDLSLAGPKLDGVEVPIVVLGIGVQCKLDCDPCLPEGTKEWLANAARLSPGDAANISTRGPKSTLVIEENVPQARSISLGCPSILISGNRTLGASIAKRISKTTPSNIRIAVSAGNPYKRELAPLELSLIKIVEDSCGAYIIQHPQALLSLSMGFDVDDKALQVVRSRFFPTKDDRGMMEWLRRYSAVYISVSQWMLSLRQFGLHIGTRIHGSQAAIQAGVPSVCLYIDSRTRELCEYMNIPHAPATEFAHEASVPRLIEIARGWDWEKYDQNRANIAARTLEFLSFNRVRPSRHLIDLVGA